VDRDANGGAVTLVVLPVRREPLTPAERTDIESEARDLLRMAAPEAAHDVRFDSPTVSRA
jgi:hypothetical protein